MSGKKISVILLDWSVRESYHSIYYLNDQTEGRDKYELIWVEYYNNNPEALKEYLFQGKLDKYLILNQTGMFSKHRMFNEGVVASEGEIIVIPDSDAIFRSTFLQAITNTFEEHKDEDIILYVDEDRNREKFFFPIKLPLDEIKKRACEITSEPPGSLYGGRVNYGSCFCAKKDSIIQMGGFDEDPGYLSYWCGAYELGFRMVNKGYKEIIQLHEWLIHCWHPGYEEQRQIYWEDYPDPKKATMTHGVRASGGFNILAIEVQKNGRVEPLVVNKKILQLRR